MVALDSFVISWDSAAPRHSLFSPVSNKDFGSSPGFAFGVAHCLSEPWAKQLTACSAMTWQMLN